MSRLLVACLIFSVCVSCSGRSSSRTIVIHVLRDPSATFANRLRQADSQFALAKPRLADGNAVIVATNEGGSFPKLLSRLGDTPPSILILESESDLSDDAPVRAKLGKAELVCGGKPAYIPIGISREEREAVEMYLRFLKTHCEDGSKSTEKTQH